MFVLAPVIMRMIMLVVMMIVFVIMSVIMFVAVIVLVAVVMMFMLVARVMSMRRLDGRRLRFFKSAGIGFERRFDMQDFRAEFFQLLFQRLIARKTDFLWLYFGCKAALADEIGEPCESSRIAVPRFRQFLRRGDNFDQPAIVHHQRIAAMQVHG